MSNKPGRLPRWATGGGADVSEPSEAEKDTGWEAGERPPAGWMNWIDERIYEWVRYLGSVPSGNLILRNVSAASQPFENPPIVDKVFTMLDGFAGGVAIQTGSGAPADAYDEFWIGSSVTPTLGNQIKRYRFGLSGPAENVTSSLGASNRTPLRILRDSAQYLMLGATTPGSTTETEISTDGITWTNFQTVDASFGATDVATNGLLGGSRIYVLIANTGNRTYTSADGITWTGPGTTSLDAALGGDAIRVVHDGTRFVAHDTGGFAHSTDGVTWAAASTTTDNTLNGVVDIAPLPGGGFVAVSFDSTASRTIVLTSADGTSFVEGTIAPLVLTPHAIGVRGDRVVVMGEIGPTTSVISQALGTVESFNRGASGTWVKGGMLVSPLPEDRIDVVINQVDTNLVVTPTELVFQAALDGGATANRTFVLVSELRTPNPE